MNIPSYVGKTFFVESNDARIRKANLKTFDTYAAGDPLPLGAKVGDKKLLPKHTEVRVLKTAVDDEASKNVMAFVEPVHAPPGVPTGWTAVTNLEGAMLNELLGYAPDEWHEAPGTTDGHTVVDSQALVRGGPPGFTAQPGKTIPAGTFVRVLERAKSGAREFARVRAVAFADRKGTDGAELGWTAASNLLPGCGPGYASADWKDQKGPFGCWEKGTALGSRVLVQIVGTGGERESVTLDTLPHYLALVEAAAADGVRIGLTSGFRTFAQQAALFKLFQQGKGATAAKPGNSNHQHGQAYDLNTHGFSGPVYNWLKQNGPKHGFVRTVRNEHWHWEYRPADAKALAPGKFALPGVTPP